MVEIAWSTLIKAVLMVFAVAVVIGGAYLFYTNFLVPQTKSDFSAQSSAVQASIQAQADSFIANLEACKAKTSNKCVCKIVIPNFAKEVTINIANKGTLNPFITINFMFNEKNFRNNQINNLSLSIAEYNGKEPAEISNAIETTSLMTLRFEDGISLSGVNLISNSIYKQGSKLYFIGPYQNPFFTKVFGKAVTQETQKAYFDSLKAC